MTTRTAMTAGELLVMPRGTVRRELVKGELHEMAPAGFEHGDVASEIGTRLRVFVCRHGLGKVVAAETGFRLARDPDTVLAADAAFVRTDRLPHRSTWGRFLELAPDLVVEVASPSDRPGAVQDTVQTWLHAGTLVVWLLWPAQQAVDVCTAAGTTRVAVGDDLDGGEVMPGFSVAVSALFDQG